MNYKKSGHLWILPVIISIFLLMNLPVYAEPTGYGIIGENQKVELFGGVAVLLVQEGAEFLDAAAYCRLNDIEDDGFNDFAVLFPVSDDEWWSVYIEYYDVGYLDEVFDIDAKRIYGGETKFYYEPAYDVSKHKLSWCVNGFYQSGEEYIEYRELFFIRDGVISVEAYCDRNEDIADAGLISYIADAVAILDGHTYDDFDPESDDICRYDFVGSFLYDEYGADDPGDENLFFEASWDGSTRTGNLSVIITFIVVIFLLAKKLKRPAAKRQKAAAKVRVPAMKAPAMKAPKRHKTISEKKPVRLRKTYDEEVFIDSMSYYRKMREEEERLAKRYD